MVHILVMATHSYIRPRVRANGAEAACHILDAEAGTTAVPMIQIMDGPEERA
jgi:hypothetical protein